MSTKLKFIYTIMALAIAWLFIYISSSGGVAFFYNWHSVKVGDTKEEVLLKLGEPYKNSEKFSFWVTKPHEDNAKLAGSVTYVTWLKGKSTLFVIGLNENQTVSYKVSGGS